MDIAMNREYAQLDAAEWIERTIGVRPSPLGREVAQIINVVGGGIYNAPTKLKRIEWGLDEPHGIVVGWNADLASWDGPGLTILLAECSRRMIRVSVEPRNMQSLLIRFHRRKGRTGRMLDRLPEIREIIDTVDGWYK